MKLLLDIGNTAVSWAVATDAGTGPVGWFDHARGEQGINDLMGSAWSELDSIATVIAVNVAGGRIAGMIDDYVAGRWQITPRYVQVSTRAFGVTNGYRRAADLGADRWVAMIAAYNRQKKAVCVVDCGTAITLDVVDASGQHRGGLILPGIAMLYSALQVNTKDIGALNVAMPTGLLGDGTQACVASGAAWLAAAAIDRLVADIQKDMPGSVDVIMTGGNAAKLADLMNTQVQLEPGLILEGLLLFSEGSD